ncbi:MAG: acyl-CoA dehydrogenase family protein [Rhizobiaceae bacterium]|nr:acyl-CoA dehydrogenase family protein [Rhizobiaceae bacterium]
MIDDATRSEFRDAIRRALEPYPETLGVTKGAKVTVEAVRQLFAVARDNGWLSLATPEEQGGLGLGMEGAAVLAVEIGRAAAPGPFLGNAVLLPMLARIPGGEPFATCLDAVLAGERLATIGVSAGFDGDARVLVEHAAGATDVIRRRESAPRTEAGVSRS